MKKEFDVKVKGEVIKVPAGTTFEKLADEYGDRYDAPIMLADFNGRYRELFKRVSEDGELDFVTVREKIGFMTYRRSVIFLMLKSLHSGKAMINRAGGMSDVTAHVLFAMDNAYYCELFAGTEKIPMTQELLDEIEEGMRRLVREDAPFMKHTVHVEKAKKIFIESALPDKKRLFEYRRSSNVNIYNLDGYEDYFYGYMLPHTGLIGGFELELHGQGFFLKMAAVGEEYEQVREMTFRPKLFDQMLNGSKWAFAMDMATIGALNDRIVSGDMEDMILAQDAVQEKEIAQIAKTIADDGDKKFILIAGPSSSGKTTFSHRLSVQLYAQGMHPHTIGLDDFFINREDMIPRPDGTLDFEDISVVDVEGFNDVCERLLAGEEVDMPTFNFLEGKREYRGKKLKMGSDDILVIEGIHGLNPRMTYRLPDERKFRVYISALTQLKIDEHNCISTRDGRLIRRIIRDDRTRGNDARTTLNRWDSVQNGEERHIFPYQENADVMFNSALIYELPILKPYVEPLLFAVPKDSPEYNEAKRLLKFLDYCLPYPSEAIAKNSILREFIGGSCFNV